MNKAICANGKEMMNNTEGQVFFTFSCANGCRITVQDENSGAIDGTEPILDNDWEKLKNTD